MRLTAFLPPLLFWTCSAYASAPQTQPAVGDEYQIELHHKSESKGSDDSSSSSSGTDVIVERIVAIRENGMELEYDFPTDASDSERATTWQLPLRIFKPFDGDAELLNTAELEARVDPWLQKANWTRAVCGQWIFTWNAFKIDCDPKSALEIVKQFDLRSNNIGDGELYYDELAAKPETMEKDGTTKEFTYVVRMVVDPAIVRKERAESQVNVAAILGTKTTFEEELLQQAKHDISGTIVVTLITDTSGQLVSRNRVVEIMTKEADGKTENQVSAETWDKKRIQ